MTTSTSVFVAEPGSIAAAGAGLCSIGRTLKLVSGQTKVIEIKYLKKTKCPPLKYITNVGKGYKLQRTNTEYSKKIFPETELRGHSPNFHIHVSVSDLYISTIDLPVLLQELCGPILGIYKSSSSILLQLFISPKGGPAFYGFF